MTTEKPRERRRPSDKGRDPVGLGSVPSLGQGVEDRTRPRLLNLREAAAYVSCSYWSVRDWCLAGLLPTVSFPPLRPREGERPKTSLRRVLIDQADLDAFIERYRSPGSL